MIELSARTAIAPKEDVVFSELDRIGTCFSVINSASQPLLPQRVCGDCFSDFVLLAEVRVRRNDESPLN